MANNEEKENAREKEREEKKNICDHRSDTK